MPTVLIVDDNPKVREMLASYCRYVGYRVRTAGCGAVALTQCLADPPTIMLLDLELPTLHGLEVLRRVSVACPGVTVIIISGALDNTARETALRLGARACLPKPFSLTDLGTLLTQPQLQDSLTHPAPV